MPLEWSGPAQPESLVQGHECSFDEVTIEPGDFDEGDALQPGMEVLLPCACGTTALEVMEWDQHELTTLQAAYAKLLTDQHPGLYHWSPSSRRKAIIRGGLQPRKRRVTHVGDPGDLDWRAPYVCFATSPSWAWALSGQQSGTVAGEWDLWQTYISDLVNPEILPSLDRHNGVHEVRTTSRVYKRHLWLVASRVKPETVERLSSRA